MVNYPSILKLDQKDLNRQFYHMINELQSNESTLATTVGDNTSGLVKKVATLETTVGGTTAGLVKTVNDIDAAIGDEDTEGTILARIKALETAS